VRLFFAVALPDTIREKLRALRDTLQKAVPQAPVTWVPAENIHLTLRFLGETDEKLLPGLREAGSEVAASVAPFELTLENLGTFGGRASPRVVWVGLREDTGQARLRALAADLERAARKLHFEPEERPFAAHATLGRVRDRRPRKDKLAPLASILENQRAWSGGTLRVDHFVLYESRLQGPRPPEYLKVETFQLKG